MKDEMTPQTGIGSSRRRFLKGALAGSAAVPVLGLAGQASAAGGADTCLELPPENAQIFNATCQYCMVQCGYKAYVWERGTGIRPEADYTGALSGEWFAPHSIVPAEKDGKEVYIAVKADPDCVVNLGDYSIRGGTAALTLFQKNTPVAEKRLQYPMIRKGGKASPLERVSWEEAIDFTAAKLIELRAAHGPDALSLVWGDWLYNLPTYAMLKFWFEGIGSSTHTGNGWFFDEESAGISAAFGTGTRSFTEEDFEETKLLVTMGANVEANGSVWHHRFFPNLSGGGAKHIDIDPRRTYQAELAEQYGGLHLMLRPGTDAILIGAIIREIIARDAWDKDFVTAHVTGFDVLRDTVQAPKFELAAAGETTGVPQEKILRAVEMLIEAKGQSMLLNEKGIMHQMAAFEAQHAQAALGAILGNAGKPGATTSRMGGHPGGSMVWPDEPPSRADNAYMYDRLAAGGVKATWAFGTNIARQLPDLTNQLPRIAEGFVIVQDRIHSDMDEIADVLLPAATWGETTTLLSSVTRRLRMTQAFMDPPGEARPDWWIVAEVAKRMGYQGFEWASPKDVWDEMRDKSDGIRELTWEMLEGAGTNGFRLPYLNGQAGPDRLFSDDYEARNGKRFATDDGKVHLERTAVLADFDPKAFEWGEVSETYPLMAFDFRLNELWNTGYTYWDKPTVNARTPDAFVLIHPEDAAARSIASGEEVELRSPYGFCRGFARVTEGVVKGAVGIPALFPKKGQEFNYATRPHASPVNGDFDTMVACDIVKV